MSRLLQVALGLLVISFAADASLLAQRAGSGGHLGNASHGSPSFSSAPQSFAPAPKSFAPASRTFAPPARSTMHPPPTPSAQNHHQNRRRPANGKYREGVGYRNRYPYFYAGYPEPLSFGYSPFGYGNYLEEPAPQLAPDSSGEPPVENPPEVAASDPPMFRPAYQPQGPPAPAQPATTLVFRDGLPSMEVHNYALAGNTLYALDGESRLEIPLAQLDLPATTEANRKSGVDFALPTSH